MKLHILRKEPQNEIHQNPILQNCACRANRDWLGSCREVERVACRYGHVSAFRSETLAEEYIEHEIEREARGEEIKCPDCEQKSKRGEIEDNGERCPCCGEGMYLEDPTMRACDSCGKRVAVAEMVHVVDESLNEWEICDARNTAPEKED